MQPKLSVIVPIYRAENTIEKCAESLFAQTLDEIEYIFVNDCTPDNSMQVLGRVIDRFPNRRNQVKIINLEVNSKQAAARNAGLQQATGEYVIHCDPDDWVDTELYESMYDSASSSDLDIVSCDYILEYKDCSAQLCTLPPVNSPIDILKCHAFYFMSLCLHMIRKKIVDTHFLTFAEGVNYSEDGCFLSRYLIFAKSIKHIRQYHYHYYKHSESITSIMNSEKILSERIRSLNITDEHLLKYGYSPSNYTLLLRLKRDVKNQYLQYGMLSHWVNLFPEVVEWECNQPGTSFAYRLAYRLSHKIGTWPMRILLMLHKK